MLGLMRIKTQVQLDNIVSAYLQSIGEHENSVGETYEETAERLGDDFLLEAAGLWWELCEMPPHMRQRGDTLSQNT